MAKYSESDLSALFVGGATDQAGRAGEDPLRLEQELDGGAKDDTLDGGAGADEIEAGGGDDVVDVIPVLRESPWGSLRKSMSCLLWMPSIPHRLHQKSPG